MTGLPSAISVVVIEDSPTVRELLVSLINAHPPLRTAGAVGSGEEALTFMKKNKADIVLADVCLPGIDGFTTTRRIMETAPLPIVICSASNRPDDVLTTFKALEAGAVAFVEKPQGPGDKDFATVVDRLIETLTIMAEVKVIRRWPKKSGFVVDADPESIPPISQTDEGCRTVAIGASTGGPVVLQIILAELAKGVTPPVLVVQHIAAGFLGGLIDWLQDTTGFHCRIAAHGEALTANTAYFAPDGYHMGINRSQQIVLSKAAPENGLRPSVSYLFRSVKETCGPAAAGVLLTGMGKDGAEELKSMKSAGALTIAQRPDSCVVSGMPGEAIRLEAASVILAPHEISAFLFSHLRSHKIN